MSNLFLILLLIFGGVGLMVFLVERFGGSPDPRRMQQLRRWIMPLVGLMLVLSLLKYYL